MKKLLLALLLACAPAFAIDTDKVLEIGTNYVARLSIPGDRNYYGAAVVLKVTPEATFYVTNAHVVPPEALRSRLVIRSMLVQAIRASGHITTRCEGAEATDECVPVTIRAISPGNDVAVIEVPHDVPLSKDDPAIANTSTTIGFYLRSLLVTKPARYDAAALGFSESDVDHPDRSQLGFEIKSEGFLGESVLGVMGTDPMRIRRTQDCPHVFLRECLSFDAKVWGYSGGALIVQRGGIQMLVGLISHYNPLSEESYAIPMDEAVRIANRLLEHPAGYVERVSEDGRFELLGAGKLRILSGPLKDKIAVQQTLAAQGGGYSQGAGGYSQGAGGYSQGAGGYSQGAGGYSQGAGGVKPSRFSVSIPGVWNGTLDPEVGLGGFRAMAASLRTLLSYKGEVTLEGGERISAIDGHPVSSLRDLVRLSTDKSTHSTNWDSTPLPASAKTIAAGALLFERRDENGRALPAGGSPVLAESPVTLDASGTHLSVRYRTRERIGVWSVEMPSAWNAAEPETYRYQGPIRFTDETGATWTGQAWGLRIHSVIEGISRVWILCKISQPGSRAYRIGALQLRLDR